MKKRYTLTFIEAKVSVTKRGTRYTLSRYNAIPGLSKRLALYLMERADYDLYGDARDRTAKGIFPVRRQPKGADGTAHDHIAAYTCQGNVIEIASITRELPRNTEPLDRSFLYFPDIRHNGISFRAGKEFSDFIKAFVDRIDRGVPLDHDRADSLVAEARLSLIPAGWERITQGAVLPDDRYLQEDRRITGMLGPGIIGWLRCDTSFSAVSPGTVMEEEYRFRYLEPVIIRKKGTKTLQP